jgi:O-antigen/teichoic acid export membrane protein
MYPFWPMLVRIVFGAKLQEAAVFLKVVAFSCAPLAIMGYAWNHLYAMKLPGRVTMLTVLSLLAAIPMFALFIHWQGPTGGVAAAVVAWSVLAGGASLVCAMCSRLPVTPAAAAA